MHQYSSSLQSHVNALTRTLFIAAAGLGRGGGCDSDNDPSDGPADTSFDTASWTTGRGRRLSRTGASFTLRAHASIGSSQRRRGVFREPGFVLSFVWTTLCFEGTVRFGILELKGGKDAS
jgi:hypothetical protein